jgi:hypothetical protein
VTLPGADAHARVGWRTGEPVAGSVSAPLPSYLASFRTLSVHVRTERALTGNAGVDARMIIRAIRAGHSYSAIEGAAAPASFDFTATNDHGTVRAGDEISTGGPLTLRVRSNAPPGFTTMIWNGTELVSGDHHEQDVSVQLPEGDGVYRAEIRATGQFPSLPWIVSNPIYVRIPGGAYAPAVATAATTPDTALALFDGRTLTGWKVEQDATSVGAVDVAETGTTRQPALRWRFGLSGGMPSSQFAALIADLPNGTASGDRVTFTARAERPMRISVQLRAGNDRWQRSIYLDIFNRQHTVLFGDLRRAGAAATDRPPLADVRSLMFVVDATNTKPGTSGRIWITQPALQR